MKQKTLIVEFVGPPGAGKTSSCNYFSRDLRRMGKEVFTSGDLKGYLKNLSNQSKIAVVIQMFFLRTPAIFHYIFFLVFNKIYSVNSIYRYLRLSLFDVTLKKYLKSHSVDIVILEQWIIQELWSATIFKLALYKRIETQLSKFYFKTDFLFYFDIDAITASERIRQRKTNDSRFDRMEDSIRQEEIKKYSNYLFSLFENSGCSNKSVFSGTESLQQNAQSFYKCLGINTDNFNFRVV